MKRSCWCRRSRSWCCHRPKAQAIQRSSIQNEAVAPAVFLFFRTHLAIHIEQQSTVRNCSCHLIRRHHSWHYCSQHLFPFCEQWPGWFRNDEWSSWNWLFFLVLANCIVSFAKANDSFFSTGCDAEWAPMVHPRGEQGDIFWPGTASITRHRLFFVVVSFQRSSDPWNATGLHSSGFDGSHCFRFTMWMTNGVLIWNLANSGFSSRNPKRKQLEPTTMSGPFDTFTSTKIIVWGHNEVKMADFTTRPSCGYTIWFGWPWRRSLCSCISNPTSSSFHHQPVFSFEVTAEQQFQFSYAIAAVGKHVSVRLFPRAERVSEVLGQW